jgi:hypothetical protein
VAIAAGLWLTWRRPFIGLGLLAAGLSVHNIVVMALLGLGTPSLLVRLVQGWKDMFLRASSPSNRAPRRSVLRLVALS